MHGLITRNVEQDHGWFLPSRRGLEICDRIRVNVFVASQALPEEFLHPSLLADVRPLYLASRFDLASFGAFHRLEVVMRESAGLGDELIGRQLAARAFHPEDGPLTDMTGALGSYKDPQSHRKVGLDAAAVRELIVMASHLLKFVDARRIE